MSVLVFFLKTLTKIKYGNSEMDLKKTAGNAFQKLKSISFAEAKTLSET